MWLIQLWWKHKKYKNAELSFDHHACTDNTESYLHNSDIKEMSEILRKQRSSNMKCEP